MNPRRLTLGCALLAGWLLVTGAWHTHRTNHRERGREELVLGLQAYRAAGQINPWNPQYNAYFQRYLNSERSLMKVLLYDLSGWELGRPVGTHPPVPLNEHAARFAPRRLLRPLNGETPLPAYSNLPPWLLTEKRLGNRLFASNVLAAAWIAEMKTRTGEAWLVATIPVADYDEKAGRSFQSAWLQAAVPLVEFERPARERWQLFALGTLAMSALFGIVLWSTARRGRALQTTASMAEQIPLDRLAVTRLPEPPDDPEAGRLVRACNRLLEQVAGAHIAQQRFVADAAHELRTPLTILRGEIQVALREPMNHPFLIETLRSNLDETVHLSRLVESLLTLARADAGQALVMQESVALAAVVRATLAKLEPLAGEHRTRLEFAAEPVAATAHVQGDAVALERIIRNLVENALKHSPAGHAVSVALTTAAGLIRLAVRDRGIGIPPEHLPKLFDRFYRTDAARPRIEGGAGLGLAIVKTLAEAQGGTVSAQSEIGIGSVFTVSFPLAATPAHPAGVDRDGHPA